MITIIIDVVGTVLGILLITLLYLLFAFPSPDPYSRSIEDDIE